MLSGKLMMYCLVAGGAYLFLVGLLLEFLCTRFKLDRGIPEPFREGSGAGWFTVYFVMEFLFFVMIPTVSYSFFYLVMPFAGMRAGLAAALFAFTMGAVPIVMIASIRLKLPMLYLLYSLLGYLLKLGGTMAIIGYLYTL